MTTERTHHQRVQRITRTAFSAWMFLLLLSAAAFRCNGQTPPAGTPVTSRGKPVIEISHRVGMRTVADLTIPATALHDAPAPSLARIENSEPYRQPLSNAALNSRLDGVIEVAPYRRKWERPLSERVVPNYVLRAGDRIVAQAPGVYQLFSVDGSSIAVNEFGSGGVVIDPRPQMMYTTSRNSDFVAQRTTDGSEIFNTPLTFGESFVRPLLGRHGWRIVTVGVERPMYPHAPQPPNLAVIETKTIAAPLQLTSLRELLSVDSAESLIIKSSALQAAMSGEHLVFAVPGRVYFAGINLKIAAAYEADFEPFLLSIDETSRAHLIVRTGSRMELWVVAPDGARHVRHELKAQYGNPIAPPIIGYNHQVYIVTRNHIVALSSDGKVSWEAETTMPIMGAGATRDDQLLASVGSTIVAYDANGTHRVVHDFLGDSLRTPPSVTDGEILVASAKRLYCLAR